MKDCRKIEPRKTYFPFLSLNNCFVLAKGSVTRKKRQMSIKLAKNVFTRKMIDFDTFTKIP